MRINHNISALNTYRQLTNNNVLGSKALEKLSSGLRINRAGDDAAGLAISEKMRGQIRGLDMASKNAQDGISLIQTAEGALNEVHAILQRMRELAVQSASDTNTDTDRSEIQKEINQLVAEIDRIATTTEFNTKKLLNGSFTGTFQIGANEGQTLTLSINAMASANLGLAAGVQVETGVDVSGGSGVGLKEGQYIVSGNSLLDAGGQVVGTVEALVVTLADGGTYTFTKAVDLDDGDIITIDENGKATLTKNLEAGQSNNVLAPGTYTISGTDVFKDNQLIGTFTDDDDTVALTDGGSIDLATVFGTALTDGDTFVVKGVDVSNRNQASGSITVIDQALEAVSAERAKLGAYQNRLEHTINNLGTASENLTAAESRIRDVDMAKEMMEFTKMAILQQAATAMLAQANQQPQLVLQLLG